MPGPDGRVVAITGASGGIGRAVVYAMGQPEDVDVSEIVVGPTGSSN